MWARVVEIMLAFWLTLSPFIFHYPNDDSFLWMQDLVCAGCIVFFVILSFWPQISKIHICTLGVGIWLWSYGYETFPEMPQAWHQNSVTIGLLLSMLAIVPNHSEKLTDSWQEFEQKKMKKT